MLQCVAVRYSVFLVEILKRQLKDVSSVLQCVAACGSVWQRVAVRCSVLQRAALCGSAWQCVAVCCSVLQCVQVRGSVLQCVAVCDLLKSGGGAQ